MYIKKILLVVAIIGLVIAAFFAYYVYNAMLSPNTSFNEDEVFIEIPTVASYNQVRSIIQPYLKDIDAFDALANRKRYVSNIYAGRYSIKKGMNNNDIINSIRSQNIPIKIAFNNQETLEQLAGRIATQIEADSLSLLESMRDTAFLKSNNFKTETALGMYIPNSYEFFWNTSAEGFRDKMLLEYKRFWNSKRLAKAKAINLTKDEVMTLASIVHEESKQPSEQPRIAGVYLNRLRIGMPLQADPTLKFAAYKLPKYKNTVIKRVLNIHKEIDSPYNTYIYPGVPPAPICTPSIPSIDAVLNEEKHNYYYMCANIEGTGYHKFSKTLSEHNAYAHQYHQMLNQRGIR